METFKSIKEWWTCLKGAAHHLCRGVVLLAKLTIGGISSLLCALWRFLTRCVGKYPDIALAWFLLAIFLTWMVTYASMRMRAVGAEAQRDVVKYEFMTFKEQHGYYD